MSDTIRRGIAGLAAALLLTAAVGSASAARLAFGSTTFRVVWTPLRMIAGGSTVSCNVTLEGSFHSATMSKVVGSLIGYVNRATAATCTGGSATIRQAGLPWHVRYRGFEGTLPFISGIKLGFVGASFPSIEVQPTGLVKCSGRFEAEAPFVATAQVTSGRVTGMRADETAPIELESFFCGFASEAFFSGTGTMTQQGSTASITVSLIDTPPLLSPSLVEFGRVEGAEASRTVTVIAGSAALRITRIELGGFGTPFSISDPNGCRGRSLAAFATCEFLVRFTSPAERGRTYNDNVIVETTARRLEAIVRATN